MRVFNAIGRLITNPLGAAVICIGGGLAIWLSVTQRRGLTPTPSGLVSTAAPKADRSGNKPNAQARAGARSRVGARRPKTSERGDGQVEHFEAENEPLADMPIGSVSSRSGQRSHATEMESDAASTVDTIGPLDPRAGALLEYPSKKAAIPDTVAANLELARWCDQHGLWDGAKTHWDAVVRLDPGNEEARRRLGFRRRDRDWVWDAARAEDQTQKKAQAFWSKALTAQHAQMKCKSKLAVPGRAGAVAHVEAVGDPRAAAAIWDTFAKDISHHGLMVGILARLKTAATSQMLAALAVYSPDEKARATALSALRGRKAADFGEKLVSLMHAKMICTERNVPNPGGDPVRELFVEGEAQNTQFLFSRAMAPSEDSLDGCFRPRASAAEIEMARRFNENQATMAKEAMDEQIGLAKAMIERCNISIEALNQRVANVLNEACAARIRPDPKDARRWLAATLGTQYQPPAEVSKPTFTDFVMPLFNPTFLPVPVAT